MVKNPKCNARYYKTLRGKLRQNILLHKLHQYSFDLTPKLMKIKKKNKWNLVKLKNFCSTKESINKMKQHTEWKNIFSNEASDKELISKIYKQQI